MLYFLRKLCLLFVSISISPSAFALLSLGDFKNIQKKSPSLAVAYVSGVGAALGVADTFARSDHNVALYCPPDDMVLRHAQFLTLMEKEIKSYSPDNSTPVEIILMAALQREFPCGVGVSLKKSSSRLIERDFLSDPVFVERVARANGMTPMRFYNQAQDSQIRMIQEYLERDQGAASP